MITATPRYPYINTYRKTPTEIYPLVEDIIRRTVARFVSLHGGDFDEMLAESNHTFMRAWNANRGGFRGNHKNFSYAVKRWVWAILFDNYRCRVRRDVNYGRTECDEFMGDYQDHDTSNPIQLVDLLDDLAGDARTVAMLVVDTPYELTQKVFGKGGEPRNWRSSLREHLRDAGWAAGRINTAFADITAALGS